MAYRDNSCMPWSAADDLRLAELALLPIQTQAQELGRTRSGIVGRRAKLRKEVSLKFHRPDGPPEFWVALDDETKVEFTLLCKNKLMHLALLSRIYNASKLQVMQALDFLKIEDPTLDHVQLNAMRGTSELQGAYTQYALLVRTCDPIYLAFPPQRKYMTASESKRVREVTARAMVEGLPKPKLLATFHPPSTEQQVFVNTFSDEDTYEYLAINRLVALPMITVLHGDNKPKKNKRTKRKNRR